MIASQSVLSLPDQIAVKAIVPRGGVIAYPTESVFGLGCDPYQAKAVERLLALKRRSSSRGVILIAADETQFSHYLSMLTESQRQMLSQSWPGPTTWLVPHGGYAPPWIVGEHDRIALRVSAHPLVQALCRILGGPLVSTSANVSGRAPARNAFMVRKQFKNGSGDASLDWVVAGQTQGRRRPSEIKDLLTGDIIRSG